MRSNQNQKWNNHACDAKPVGLGAPSEVAGVTILDSFSDLVSERAGNRAGEISGANRLPLLEAKESEVFNRSAAVAVSTGSWCGPSGDSFAITDQLQSEAGVNIFDSSESDFTFGQWVGDYNQVGPEFNLGENVVSPDKSQHEQHDAAGLDTVLLIEPNGLNHGQSGQYQARYGNHVARSRSVIHSQILSRQEANYVAG